GGGGGGGGGGTRGKGGRGGARPERPRGRAVGAAQAAGHVRGDAGEQPGVRADGGGGGQGTRLLPRRTQGVRRGRGGLQLEVATALLHGLRADRGLFARVVLRVPGGVGGGGRRGGTLAAVPPVAARLLAGAGGGSDRAVAGLARARGSAAAGGRVATDGPAAGGGGDAELLRAQRGAHEVPGVQAGRGGCDEQAGGGACGRGGRAGPEAAGRMGTG